MRSARHQENRPIDRRNVASIVRSREIVTNGDSREENGGFARLRQNGTRPNGRPMEALKNVVNNKMVIVNEIGKTYEFVPNLRHLLRPTVTQKIQEKKKIDYDTEDTDGPYNFRKLLRPAEYLPTESLRKRKGGLMAVNGGQIVRDRAAGKHVKRRAPLAPNQSKAIGVKK